MNFWLDILPVVIAALLIWWGLTGIIIYLCGRREWRPWVFGGVTLLQPLAMWQLWSAKNDLSVGGTFATFFWAVIIWSWLETSYYSGFVVGRKMPEIEPDAPLGVRFRRAIGANLYHELSIIALSLVVIGLGWGGRNETGLWAFMILHWTHQSAKINIFLGVNNLTTEYLPDNLKYMAQYFTQRPSLNMFFPFSVTITTVLATFLFGSILSATNAGEQAGHTLLFILMAAAVLEHWWLVTPKPSRAWQWALKSREHAPTPKANVEHKHEDEHRHDLPKIYVVCGYLGSGKTTLIRHILPQLDGRVAVVVNDFGAVGVDAGAVLELPGGCVCCTMQKNLTGQIVKLLDEYQPEKIIIEPSGVAGIEGIIQTLASPRLHGRLGEIEIITVVDAPRLLTADGLQKFTLTQIKAAQAVVVSKIDLVTTPQLSGVLALVANLNPSTRLFPALEGQVSAAQLFSLAPLPLDDEPEHAHETEHRHEHEQPHSEETPAGFISFARQYDGIFEAVALKRLFDKLGNGYFGPVERAKGLFTTPGGVRQAFDLAGGVVTCRLLPGSGVATSGSRFMLVARDLAADELDRALQNCLAEVPQMNGD
jgi:putative photosynthetic complex assembly protein 2